MPRQDNIFDNLSIIGIQPEDGKYVYVITDSVGFAASVVGNSLSFNVPFGRALDVTKNLAKKDGGHNKFLEHMFVQLAIYAPRYWYLQFATYRVGNSRLQESTMHTIHKRPIEPSDFYKPIHPEYIGYLNYLREKYLETKNKDFFELLKAALPEGYMQWSIWSGNYKVLRHIYQQRKNHKLGFWHIFFEQLLEQLDKPEFITE